MKKKVTAGLVLGLGLVMLVGGAVRAEECDNPGSLTDAVKISQCISKYNGIVDAISAANSTNQQELKSLQGQVVRLQGQIKSLDGQVVKLSEEIFEREVKVGEKEALLCAKVR